MVDDDPISFGFASNPGVGPADRQHGSVRILRCDSSRDAGTHRRGGTAVWKSRWRGSALPIGSARYELFGDDPLIVNASLSRGFRIEDPDVLAPWGSSVAAVLKAFAAAGAGAPRQVTPLYYIARGTVLGGLQCQVGFHFEAKGSSSSLNKIQLFDNGERDIEASYRAFQDRLLQQFGPPTIQKAGALSSSMPDCEWRV